MDSDRRAGLDLGPARRGRRRVANGLWAIGRRVGEDQDLPGDIFRGLGDNLAATLRLPVAAVHFDLVRAPSNWTRPSNWPAPLALSLGVIDGRNVWRADLEGAFNWRRPPSGLGPQRLMVGPSCSLLHCPIDLDEENSLDAELRGWMAFAKQKLGEIAIFARGLAARGGAAIADALGESHERVAGRRRSPRIHRPEVKEAFAGR